MRSPVSPEEACGLLAGRKTEQEKLIEKVYLLPNADHAAEHFTISSEDQWNLILSLAENEPVLRAFSIAGGDAETEELLIEEGQSWRN